MKSGNPSLDDIKKNFASARRKFIDNALNFTDAEFKLTCHTFFGSMNESVEIFFKEAKHCYAEEEIERARNVQEAMPILCSVDNETRKGLEI